MSTREADRITSAQQTLDSMFSLFLRRTRYPARPFISSLRYIPATQYKS